MNANALTPHAILREHIRTLERKLGILNESEMACCQVTLAQCHAIVEIGRAETLALNELAERMGVDSSTMSRTVQQLVAVGKVLREPGQEDRRKVVIRLTDEGAREFRSIETAMDSEFRSVMNAIPAEKRAQVLESLSLLLAAMPDMPCCGTTGEEWKNEEDE